MEISFPSGANYTLRKQARSWLLGLARKNKMSWGKIKVTPVQNSVLLEDNATENIEFREMSKI